MTTEITKQQDILQEYVKLLSYNQLLSIAISVADEIFSVEEAGRYIMTAISRFFEWPVSHLFIVDFRGNLVSTDNWYFEDKKQYDVLREATLNFDFVTKDNFVKNIFKNKKISWLDGLSFETNFARSVAALDVGLHAVIGVPILANDKVFGVLEFFNCGGVKLNQLLLEVLSQVSSQLGRVIERKFLNDIIAQKETLLNILDNSGIDKNHCFPDWGLPAGEKDNLLKQNVELLAKIDNLEKFKKMAVDREIKMIELKREMALLKK